MIFLLSAQPATRSAETSTSLTQEILEMFPSFNELAVEEQAIVVENSQFVVRKLAHFSIYTCLGIFMYTSFLFICVNKKKSFSWAICTLYAISDESHQYFVEGRSCELRDMLIDSLGAICGIMIAFGIYNLIRAIIVSRKNVLVNINDNLNENAIENDGDNISENTNENANDNSNENAIENANDNSNENVIKNANDNSNENVNESANDNSNENVIENANANEKADNNSIETFEKDTEE